MDELIFVAIADIEYLTEILELPFLESFETHDLHAADAMSVLARNDRLGEVLSHQRLVDADESTWPALVVGAAVTEPTATKVTHLLDTATVESGMAPTHLTDNMRVSIIRSDRSQPGSLDLVFEAASFVEKTMAMPFPTDHIMVTLDDGIDYGDAAGFYTGYAFALKPKYEDLTDKWEYQFFTTAVIHELSHYFWSANTSWLDEGMATIHEYLYWLNQGMSQAQLKPRRGDCEAHDLQELTAWFGHDTHEGGKCNYFMGEMLFQDLLHEIGVEQFLEKVRGLYSRSMLDKENSKQVGIEQVRQVFYDQTDIVERHWSGDWNAPENRDMTEGIERASHQLVLWDNLPAFNPATNTVAFGGKLLGNAVLLAPHISIAREKTYNFSLYPFDSEKMEGTILPYHREGTRWVLDDFPGYSVAVIYDVQAQSFRIEFPFPKALETPTDYVVVVRGFQNTERVPTIGSREDILGYSRIRHYGAE